MRAARHTTHGGPGVLHVAEVADPVPGPDDVLIAVRAAALNRLDVLQREGPGLLPGFALPHVPGMDIAGDVVAVGADVPADRLGERVIVNPAVGCGRCAPCRAGDDAFCTDIRIIGGNVPGGYAELVAVPASHVHPVPADVPYAEAATVAAAYSTAWQALVVRGRLQPGEVLLVCGAGSGVTIAAVQLAKRLGARVIVSSRSRKKLDRIAELGADVLIDSTAEDLTEAAMLATAGRGVDVVLNHLGPALLQPALYALRPRGRMLLSGNNTGRTGTIDLAHFYHCGVSLLGVEGYGKRDFDEMLASHWGAGFRYVVDSVFPLERAAEAQERLESVDCYGKVVLVPDA